MRSPTFLLAFVLACSTHASFGQEAAKVGAYTPAPGEVRLRLPGGGLYIGTVTDGIPDGKGFFKDADGMMYEGDVRMGQRTGLAEGVFPLGDRYQGEWKDGKPHGTGKMSYMLGGSYEGEWKNGERDGKGVMVFAGSGRRAEVHFVDGHRVGQAPERPPASAATGNFSLYSRYPAPGSRLPDEIVSGAKLPPDRGFADMTPEQKEVVRSYYHAMEEGDDPPYATEGGWELFEVMSRLAGRLALDNKEVTVYVAVDAAGKVTSVNIIGSLDGDTKRRIGTAATLPKYAPGRCSGQPCPGVVPFRMKTILK